MKKLPTGQYYHELTDKELEHINKTTDVLVHKDVCLLSKLPTIEELIKNTIVKVAIASDIINDKALVIKTELELNDETSNYIVTIAKLENKFGGLVTNIRVTD